MVNMSALIKGHLLSSFWVVDKRHFYIGSASMDWRSLATVFKTPAHHIGIVVLEMKCMNLLCLVVKVG